MNRPLPHRLANTALYRSPTVTTWDAKEPPHELRALLDRLANPPVHPAVEEFWRRYHGLPELDPANKDKWI